MRRKRNWATGKTVKLVALLGCIVLADAAVDSFAIAGDDAKAAQTVTAPAVKIAQAGAETVRVRASQMMQLRIVKVEVAAISTQKAAIGQIAFNEDASTVILSPFSGRVTKLIARIGDTIDKGAPLFEIDSPEVVQAQTDLIAAVQGVGKARSQLGLAQRSVARLSELLAARATSVREADQAKSDLSSAESDLKTAEGTLQAARNKLRVLVGRTEDQIAKIERDRIIDPFFTVTSPIGGTVVARRVGPGQYVRSDTQEPLFSISDLSTMWLKASVPENDIPFMQVGQELEVVVPALKDRVFGARITAIGAASDSTTHRVVVRSEIPNPGSALKAEMFASFKITTGASPLLPLVPLEAVIREGNLATVWVEREALVFERRKVELGVEAGNRIQIVSGLTAGERVVGRGAIFVDNEWRQ